MNWNRVQAWTCVVCGVTVRGPIEVIRDHTLAHGQAYNPTGIAGNQEKILEAKRRKEQPIFSGLLAYFPDACLAVANCSWVGNEQHHPGAPLHWDKTKSTDEKDALVRHLLQSGTLDTDGVRHSAKVAWRALAMLQRELDKEKGS